VGKPGRAYFRGGEEREGPGRDWKIGRAGKEVGGNKGVKGGERKRSRRLTKIEGLLLSKTI